VTGVFARTAELFADEENDRPAWRGEVPWPRGYEAALVETQARDRLARAPAFQDGKARPEQLLPGTPAATGARWAATVDSKLPSGESGDPVTDDSWVYWLLRCGRGFGKTETGAQAIIEWARAGIGPLLMGGPTAQDVRDTMVEVGPSSVLKVAPPDFMPDYEPSKLRLTFPNDVIVELRSADDPDRFRGVQFVRAWLDELAAWKRLDEAWDQIRYTMRVKHKHGGVKLIITTTPKNHKVIKWLSAHPRAALTVRSSHDNFTNLAEEFQETIADVEHSRLGRQEVYGDILEELEGSLWKQSAIDIDRITVGAFEKRLDEGLRLVRVVCGVDPAGGRTENGILTVAKGNDGHAYVLDDVSAKGGPDIWVPRLDGTYSARHADKVIAEVNFGGDMVENTIHGAGHRNIAVKVVRASRGKAVRAEPVSMLYDRHIVHHVGFFPELEREQTGWVPDEARESPNRMDALVWALTELFGLYDDKEKRKARMPRGDVSRLMPQAGTGGWSADRIKRRRPESTATKPTPVFPMVAAGGRGRR